MSEAAQGAAAAPSSNDGSPIQEAAGEAIAQEAADYRKMKHRIKVDQEELELDYDDLVREAQKGRSADKRFKEAAAARKEAESFLQDPWGYLRQKGKDPYEVAESLLLEKIKWESLSDEQKEALRATMERDELKRWKEEHEKAELEKEAETVRAQAIEEIDSDIADALKSVGKKPTPRLIARIAENMIAHLEKDGSRVSAKDILTRVQKEYVSDISEYLSQMTPEQLREHLPKHLLDGLRKADVDKVRAGDPARSTRRIVSTDPSPGIKPKKAMSWDEAFREKEKRWSGRK